MRSGGLLPTGGGILQSRMARYITLVVLLASGALVVFLISRGQRTSSTDAAQRPQPFRIGALTESWGPTPHVTACVTGSWRWAIASTSSLPLASASHKAISLPCRRRRASWCSTG